MRTFLAVTLAILAAAITAAPSEAQEGKTNPPRVRRAVTLSAAASDQLGERVLGHADLPQRAKGHRLAVIRVTAEDVIEASEPPRRIATVTLFDHTALESRRLMMDLTTNLVLLDERLSGHPQRSDRERDEAEAILRRDPALARLLAAGGVLDGGFIVDDPRGSAHRAIQLKLMRADRRALLRSIVVDLTTGQIASVSRTNGGR